MGPDLLLTVPTVRDFGVLSDYFENARRHKFPLKRVFALLVTEDFCDKAAMKKLLKDEGVQGAVLGAKERTAWMQENKVGDHERLIPRRSHAETSFGLLWLWKEGFPLGAFLDDDTKPTQHDYFGTHLSNLESPKPMPRVSTKQGWVNVLHQQIDRHHLHPRGYPYAHMGIPHSSKKAKTGRVVASQGLWTNVADLDAARILVGGDLNGQGSPRTVAEDFPESFVVEHGSQTTISSMNVAFRREVVPAFWQFPMDDNEWKVGRFDDIWSGFCLKHIADAKGLDIVHGHPLCQHNKAPRSTFKDLVAEANGLELNEHFTKHLPDVGDDPEWGDAYRLMASSFQKGEFKSYVNGAFLNHCGRLMEEWVDVIERLEP